MVQAELEKIASDSWSIRPGDPQPGEYIGSLFRVGLEFQFFRDSAGAYWYRRYPEYEPGKRN